MLIIKIMIKSYSRLFQNRFYDFHFIINIIAGKEIEITEIYSSMNNALRRFIDLIDHILENKQTQNNIITVNICDLNDSLGTFNPQNTICISRELLKNLIEFEKTFFHELVHYIFNGVFEKNNSYLPHLSEAIAVYFENYYYPDFSTLSFALLYDRLTTNKYAAGYYIIDQLIKNERSTFKFIVNNYNKDNNSNHRREVILKELALSESRFARELIFDSIDILLIEPSNNYLSDGYGLIYRVTQMNSPIITKIGAGDIYKNHQNNIAKIYEKIPVSVKEQLLSDSISIINEDDYESIASYYGKVLKYNSNFYNRIYNKCFLYN